MDDVIAHDQFIRLLLDHDPILDKIFDVFGLRWGDVFAWETAKQRAE